MFLSASVLSCVLAMKDLEYFLVVQGTALFLFFSSPFPFAVRRRVPTTILYTLSYSGPVVSPLVTFFLSYMPVFLHMKNNVSVTVITKIHVETRIKP